MHRKRGRKDWRASRSIIGTCTEPTSQNNASWCAIIPGYNQNSHNTSGTNPTSTSTYDANVKFKLEDLEILKSFCISKIKTKMEELLVINIILNP